ncbi:MAG: hypothetical protein ACU843_02655 [Gammaproteobacteria bacterium]
MSAESIVNDSLNNVPKAVAAGIVDMGTGMLLGVKTVDEHPQGVLDMLAAATQELYEGDSAMSIEKIFKRTRGDGNSEPYFREIIINSKNLIHVFSRLMTNPKIALTVVCQGSANLGMVVMKVRELAQKGVV